MEPSGLKDASDKSEELFQLKTQSDVENNQHSEKDDDDNGGEEDVPGDFFDDFLKEDFMAGLDIVDEDEGDEEKDKQNSYSNGRPTNSIQMRKLKRRKSPTKDKRRKVKKERRKVDDKDETRKRRKNDSEEQKKIKKSRDTPINADEFDIRRDPKKTKRDIARDKAKCEKDKEKKIITEKLKLVETGLVPPGMEMEMDIEQVKRQKKEMEREENSSKLKSRSPQRSSRTNDASPRRRKSRSPIQMASPRRRSPVRRVSPRRSPRRISPRRMSPRRISPRRSSPRRSPIRRSPVRRSRERSSGRPTQRRSRSLSPYYRNRRTRYSPVRSRVSPNHDPYSRHRRSRSRSLKRKRDEKKSFLQEIAEKLNETRPIQMMPIQHMQPHPSAMAPEVYNLNRPQMTQLSHPSPVPAPAPVPPPMLAPQFNPSLNRPPLNHPPQNRPPHLQSYDPYDQNFFIGTPQPQVVPNYSGSPHQIPANLPRPPMPVNTVQPPVKSPSVVMNRPGNVGPPSTPSQPPNSQPSNSQPSNSMGLTNYRAAPQVLHRRIESKEDIAKLFQDKKITLSEFLAITAKPEVYSECPTHLQEKIKVISRCQDAIKVLGNSEKKFTGPLVVRKTKKMVPLEDKFKSPLMKFSQLKIPFTEVPKKEQRRSAFTNYVDYLLQSIGLMNEVVVEVDDQDAPTSVGTTARLDQGSPPPPPQISHGRSTSHNEPPPKRAPNLTHLSNNQLSKFIQTEVWKCHDCEKRNKIAYKSTGIQSGGEPVTYSISTQVSEDDFFVKIPKNQSLASLTPAQLLAKSGSKFSRNVEVDDFDLMFPSKNTRTTFGHGSETYGAPRYNQSSPPSRYVPPNRDDPSYFQNPPFPTGGRGRGNQPPQSSFNNSYY